MSDNIFRRICVRNCGLHFCDGYVGENLMAIEFKKADVAQRKEQGSSKAKTEAARRRQEEAKGLGKSVIKAAIKASPNVDDSGAIVGDEKYLVKSGEHMPVVDISNKNIAVVVQPPKKEREEINLILQKHKERLAYNAAYQRDLRTIKRLGLNCTVAEFRRMPEYGKP